MWVQPPSPHGILILPVCNKVPCFDIYSCGRSVANVIYFEIFLHLFIFTLYVSLYIRWILYRQQTVWLFLHSGTYLLIDIFQTTEG